MNTHQLRTQFLIMHWLWGIDFAYNQIKQDAKNAKS